MKTVDDFSYGALWIRQAITQALASQSKAIRIPTDVVDKLGKMMRVASRLEEGLGREPTDEELAAEVGMTSRRITQMRMAAIRPASLDAHLGVQEPFTRQTEIRNYTRRQNFKRSCRGGDGSSPASHRKGS